MRPTPVLHLLILATSTTAALRAAEPVPTALFHCVDPNLEVTVWAKSPQLFNPTNIDVDHLGRIWVAEGVNYRKHFDRRPEGDRIMVLQDTDGDGSADKAWPFVQEKFLRAPMGVAVIGNRVVVSMAPDLIVYTDRDGDAIFDASKGDTREVLLTGFNGRAHDHSLHSVTAGPDGKWYFSVGNCGALFTDKDGKTWRIGAGSQVSSWWPKDPERPDREPATFAGQKSDDGKVYVGGFIARMNPDGTGVEIVAHNLRNSYENAVTSFGDVFASDNDDQPACRVFAVLPGANYGFASRDGWRSWQADRRPGQDVKTATWRQQDPGVAPAGDIYGGGAPTGVAFYENGALGPQHEGTLLACESARNTVFGYRPKRDGAGWKLERFDFLTTNREGKVIGTDYTGGDATARVQDTKTLFRPSDVAVGPDGAVYIADWYDARVGGHADLDDTLTGAIYRVAPKGFKSVAPKIDLGTTEGAVTALGSPAVNVRALGYAALAGARIGGAALQDLAKAGPFQAARAYRIAERQGSEAERKAILAQLGENAARLAKPERREPVAWAATLNPTDRAELEAWGLACDGREAEIFAQLLPQLGNADARQWSDRFAAIAWRLHPPRSVAAFKTRAMAVDLPEKARRDALTAIGFNESKDAAEAMLAVAQAFKGTGTSTDAATTPNRAVFDTALWWLLNRKDNAWKDHGLAAALKATGLYDPASVQLTAVSLPEPPAPSFSVADASRLTGDAGRGEATSQRCLMCHRIGAQGADFGPELTAWGKTQPTETILRAIVEPGADIAHGFYGTELETTDGLVIQGLLINDADPLIVQCMGGQTQTVPKTRVKAKRPMNRSLMMNPVQLGLTAQDVADIAAFLKR